MKDTEQELTNETEKWLEKLKGEEIEVKGEKGKMFLENIEAYTEDAQHFLDEEDLVRAFEAVVWAWSWLEIGEELDEIARS